MLQDMHMFVVIVLIYYFMVRLS